MSKLITHAIYNGTKLELAVAGANVDSVMLKLRKKRELRNASAFLFFNRKTGKLVDSRIN